MRTAAPRSLLIKRWGAGFWADVDHVVGQLAAAEIMGRIPVVHWGTDGPYANGCDDTFTLYFDPVSDISANALLRGSIWPPPWVARNLLDPLPFPITGKIDASYGNYYMCSEKTAVPVEIRTLRFMRDRQEDVLVSFCWEHLDDIAAAAPEGSRFSGLASDVLRRLIVQERLRLQPAIAQEVDRFWHSHLAGHPALAVHVRASDKIVENPALPEQNARALDIAKAWQGKVFLLTDCERHRGLWADALGTRLITQDCLRTTSRVIPNYLLPGANGYRNGVEILLDTYVAARCDRFIGTHASNVGKFVLALSAADVRFLDQAPHEFRLAINWADVP